MAGLRTPRGRPTSALTSAIAAQAQNCARLGRAGANETEKHAAGTVLGVLRDEAEFTKNHDPVALAAWTVPNTPQLTDRGFPVTSPSPSPSPSRRNVRSGSRVRKTRVSYVTDVEGNMEYFPRVVELSDVLFFNEDGDLDLVPDSFFVFGGDAVDKGPGDLAFLRAVISLKRRYPERVFFILGNRDVNKCRLTSELDDSEFAALSPGALTAVDIPGPYWVPAERQKLYGSYLGEIREAWDEGADGPVPDADDLDNKVNRLKWMLRDTMGCPETFEMRRVELAANAGVLPAGISDEEVVQSYIETVDDHGLMRTFLKLGQLAVVIGDTLFVHGGINEDNVGVVPGVEEVAADVDSWVHGLNEFCKAELEDWMANPTFNADRSSRGGEALMDYGVPGGNGGKTVVYETLLDNGHGKPVDAVTAAFLRASGIRRVCVGHTPHGDCPTVVKGRGVELVMADTSYSDMSAPDNRGIAASEVLVNILFDRDQVITSATHVSGINKDGLEIDYVVADDHGDAYVGRQVEDGRSVKARLKSGQYVLYRGKGYKLSIDLMTAEEVRALTFVDV